MKYPRYRARSGEISWIPGQERRIGLGYLDSRERGNIQDIWAGLGEGVRISGYTQRIAEK